MESSRLFDLQPHGPDTLVGVGPRYPWGGLYGGQIVAQALRAAASTVDPAYVAHSLRAYFIRRGDHAEPVRYEIDRIRNGRSFVTRRVVARQSNGVILNCEASFQQREESRDLQTMVMPDGIPGPDELEDSTWSPSFQRRMIPRHLLATIPGVGGGRIAAWMRVSNGLDAPVQGAPDTPVLPAAERDLVHRCWLAYLSDDLPTDAVVHALGGDGPRHQPAYAASLDHTIWFHRQPAVDRWHLYEMTCVGFVGGRGLAIGQVFADDGVHVATVAQEVLSRDAHRAAEHTSGATLAATLGADVDRPTDATPD